MCFITNAKKSGKAYSQEGESQPHIILELSIFSIPYPMHFTPLEKVFQLVQTFSEL
jgi:hypothetical protein